MVMVRDTEPLKFLCGYGRGIKILPPSTDGKFRYVGGITRILSVDRSISFAELMVKLKEFCGFSVTLRCQLPNGDLETLISIKSDAELADLLEEYDWANASSKSSSKMVRAILTPPTSIKRAPASKQPYYFTAVDHHAPSCPCSRPLFRQVSRKVCYYPGYMQGNPRSLYCGPHRHSIQTKSSRFHPTIYSHY